MSTSAHQQWTQAQAHTLTHYISVRGVKLLWLERQRISDTFFLRPRQRVHADKREGSAQSRIQQANKALIGSRLSSINPGNFRGAPRLDLPPAPPGNSCERSTEQW